jgi:hypothetical protein
MRSHILEPRPRHANAPRAIGHPAGNPTRLRGGRSPKFASDSQDSRDTRRTEQAHDTLAYAASYLLGRTTEESDATHPDHACHTTKTPGSGAVFEVGLFFGSTTSARDRREADGGRATGGRVGRVKA